MLEEYKELLKKTGQHLLTGVSYMLPVITIGGLGWTLAWTFGGGSQAALWKLIESVGDAGMNLFIPIMAAYVAFAIADLPGIAPGLIAGVLAVDNGSGFLGALLGGLLAGYVTYTVVRKIKVADVWRSTWITFAPAIGTFVVATLMVFVVGPPVSWAMDVVARWLQGISDVGGALMGLVLGALGGVDYGGPLSNVQFSFCLAAMERGITTPMGISGVVVSVAAVGMALASLMAPHLYSKAEREYGKTALAYALIGGFSEIAIPYAVADPIRVTMGCVVGAMVAGVIAGAFGLTSPFPGLGVTLMLVVNKPLVWLLSLATGSVVTALVVNFLKSRRARPEPENEAA